MEMWPFPLWFILLFLLITHIQIWFPSWFVSLPQYQWIKPQGHVWKRSTHNHNITQTTTKRVNFITRAANSHSRSELPVPPKDAFVLFFTLIFHEKQPHELTQTKIPGKRDPSQQPSKLAFMKRNCDFYLCPSFTLCYSTQIAFLLMFSAWCFPCVWSCLLCII